MNRRGGDMSTSYRDRWIECTPDALRIHGYYFPWGTKTIPYASIRTVTRVKMGLFTGQARIWGTAHPRYWAGLDPQRLSKTEGIVLDIGKFVRPFITPDDPAAVEGILRERFGAAPSAEDT